MDVKDYEVEVFGKSISVFDGLPLSPPVHTVLLFHGQKSSRDMWLTTIRDLQSIGHRAIAIDIPGNYGSQLHSKAEFVLCLFSALQITCRPVLVSVSVSGKYVQPILDSGHIKGWVAVSPSSPPLPASGAGGLGVLVVYGEHDVKARPICEKTLALRHAGVKCVMVRAVGEDHEPVKEKNWSNLLKCFLSEL